MTGVATLPITGDSDVSAARIRALRLCADRGYPDAAAAAFATAVSELARNALVHAGRGEIALAVREGDGAVTAVVRDQGPGIADPALALTDGWSTAGSLGLGLPSARRLVDEFALESHPGAGTTVRIAKLRPGPPGPSAPGGRAPGASR